MALTVATQLQADRLRRDVDANTTVLPDSEVDALFTEAMETYSDAASIAAQTRVLFLQGLLTSSAKMNDYRQNESEEKSSQIYARIKDLYLLWKGELADVVVLSAGSAARFGRTTSVPARIKEYPGW